MQPSIAAKAGKWGGKPPSTQLRSDAINIARVIGILGIVYAHSRTGLSNAEMSRQPLSVYSISYWLFVEVFGRSSVPLLSVISGWLVVATLGKRNVAEFVRGRVKNLLAPMAAWNLIALFLVGTAIVVFGRAGQIHTFNMANLAPHGMTLVNEVTHLTELGRINGQTAFLRDIFVCMLFAPLLLRLPTYLLWTIIGVAFFWAVSNLDLYVILRPQILAFFTLGVIARRGSVGEGLRRVPLLLLLSAFVLIASAKIWVQMQGISFQVEHPYLSAAADNLLRVPAAAVYWRLALWLASTSLSTWLLAAERYIFVTFCSHIITTRMIFAPVEARFFGEFGDPLWLLSFIMQPLAALAGAWLISHALLRFSPALAELLSGGRLTRARRVNERP